MRYKSGLLGLILAGSVLVSPAFAADATTPEFTFRMADDSNPGQTLSETTGRWSDEINAQSHGRIHVQHFTSATLGDALALIQGVQNGTVDMIGTTVPNLAGVEKGLGLFSMPYLVDDVASARRLANSPVAASLLARLEDKRIKPFTLGTNGFLVITMRDRAIQKPEDLKGLRVRSLPNKINQAFYTTLGAVPVAIPYTQVYLALKQGVVDGIESSLTGVYTTKLYEVAKNVSLTNHAWLPQVFAMNLAAFKKLPPDLQKVVADAAKVAADQSWDMEEKGAENFRKLIQDKGTQVGDVADKAAFRKVLQPVYDQFGPELGSADLVQMQKFGKAQ